MHLTWLDLSFNQITEVEGLAKLTRLQDLSLHHNQIKDIDALAETPSIVTLSLGGGPRHLSSALAALRQLSGCCAQGRPFAVLAFEPTTAKDAQCSQAAPHMQAPERALPAQVTTIWATCTARRRCRSCRACAP